MKKVCYIFLLISVTFTAHGQSYLLRNASTSQPSLINPAICGAIKLPTALLSCEKQWGSVSHAPKSFFVSGELRLGQFDFYDPRKFINESRFRSMERIGLGAGIYSDINGPFHEINLLLTYSYHLQLNEKMSLSFGIAPKLNYHGLNVSELKPLNEFDPLFTFEKIVNVNASVGIYLYHEEFFTGFSMVNIFNNQTSTMYYSGQQKVFYGRGGYRFRNESGSMILEPSTTVKYFLNEKELQADFQLKIYIRKYGWLSISYLNESQLELITAFRVRRQYYLAYKFGSDINGISSYTGNTHGFMLGINLGIDKKTANIY